MSQKFEWHRLPRVADLKLNIRARLIALFLSVAMPLVAINCYSIYRQYQALNSEARRATTFQAAIAVRTLKGWIEAQEKQLSAIAGFPPLKHADNQAIKALLQTALSTQNDWYEIYLVDRHGKQIVSTGECGFMGQDQFGPFFRSLVASGKSQISGYMWCNRRRTGAILVGSPVFEGKSIRSYLLAAIKPQAVLELFRGLGEGNGSVIAVVDGNKRVLARTLANDRWMGKDFSRAKTVQASQRRTPGTIEAVGIVDPTERAYAFDRIPGAGWLVIVGVPTSAIYGPSQELLVILLLLAAGGLGLSFYLAYTYTGHFTGPIYDLVKEALAIGRGDLTKRVSAESGDELGLLARAFNQMAHNLEVNRHHKQMVEKISESIRQSLDLETILNRTTLELGTALGASRCCLALVAQSSPQISDEVHLEFNHVWWDPLKHGTALKHNSVIATKGSILRNILDQGKVLSLDVLDQGKSAPLFDHADYPTDWRSIKSLIACPIIMHNRSLGLILVHQCDANRVWIDSELELVEAIARHVGLAVDQAYLYAQTKTLAEQELMINHIVRSVRSSLDLDTILSAVTRELGQAISADRCQIAQPRLDGPLVVSHEWHSPSLEPVIGMNLYSDLKWRSDGTSVQSLLGIDLKKIVTLYDGQDAAAITTQAPIAVICDVTSDPRTGSYLKFLKMMRSVSLIAAPLLDQNRLLGVLMVHQTTKMREWTPTEISLVAAIADQVAVAISHAHLFAQVQQQAITDGLTSLYNHVYLKQRLAEELRRAQRKSTHCSLLMIDLDKLKQINDMYGHPVGDQAIRQVAWTLKNLLRSGDTAARYGGEEFAVILPETSLPEATIIAERLCRQVNSTSVPGLGLISVSIGVASFPAQAGDLAQLVEKADQALYRAKRLGRNQVCASEDSLESDSFAVVEPVRSRWLATTDMKQ